MDRATFSGASHFCPSLGCVEDLKQVRRELFLTLSEYANDDDNAKKSTGGVDLIHAHDVAE